MMTLKTTPLGCSRGHLGEDGLRCLMYCRSIKATDGHLQWRRWPQRLCQGCSRGGSAMQCCSYLSCQTAGKGSFLCHATGLLGVHLFLAQSYKNQRTQSSCPDVARSSRDREAG